MMLITKRISKKHFTPFILISLALFVSFGCQRSHIGSKNKFKILIIDNVHIVDVRNNQILTNKQVIIERGIIKDILSAGTQTNSLETKIINGKGGYLTPGLIDMHVHGYTKSAFELSLSHGVTHVRVMNGIPQQLEWRDEQTKGYWLASEMTISTPIIRADSQPLSWQATTSAQAEKLVKKAKEQGYDLIKAYGSLKQETLEALIKQAKALSIPVAKHGPHPADNKSWYALNGIQSLEHAEDIYQGPLNYKFDEERLTNSIQQLATLNVPITPTLNIFWQLTKICNEKENFLATLPTEYISPIITWEEKNNQVARWLNCSNNHAFHNNKVLNFLSIITKKLSKANIPILVGSDAGVLLSPHGLATHNELKLLVESGLTTFEALQAATIHPAQALNKEDEIGEIKIGLKANVILSMQNPMEDLSVLTFPDGLSFHEYWLTKENIENIRAQAIENQSIWTELLALLYNY